jgi:glyoxylase-like metal-dependent hydrolase (beta-lactamase superfamily II)
VRADREEQPSPGTLGLVATPAHFECPGVRIDKLIVGPFENNVFIVRCTGTGEAVLLDAANEHELLLDVCRATGVRRVLTTHGHWDHIQAVEAVRDAGIDVGIAIDDAEMLPSYDFVIADDEEFVVGDLRLRAVHTPGHTRGSTSFVLEGSPIVFTGDTLFPGGPGNTSTPGGSFDEVITSIDRRLFTLAPETLVLPGHGLDTTVGEERPHLDEWVERGW